MFDKKQTTLQATVVAGKQAAITMSGNGAKKYSTTDKITCSIFTQT